MDKTEIRRKIKTLKQSLTEKQKVSAEIVIMHKIEQLPQFKDAKKILLYNSLPDELPTQQMIANWNRTRKIYLPRVCGDELEILRYNPATMTKGSYGIIEPVGNVTINPLEIDLVIVPAVAYDPKGNRIGRGKGYYDRLLSRMSAYKAGVCYHFQLVDTIIPSPYDIPVDIVITECAK